MPLPLIVGAGLLAAGAASKIYSASLSGSEEKVQQGLAEFSAEDLQSGAEIKGIDRTVNVPINQQKKANLNVAGDLAMTAGSLGVGAAAGAGSLATTLATGAKTATDIASNSLNQANVPVVDQSPTVGQGTVLAPQKNEYIDWATQYKLDPNTNINRRAYMMGYDPDEQGAFPEEFNHLLNPKVLREQPLSPMAPTY